MTSAAPASVTHPEWAVRVLADTAVHRELAEKRMTKAERSSREGYAEILELMPQLTDAELRGA